MPTTKPFSQRGYQQYAGAGVNEHHMFIWARGYDKTRPPVIVCPGSGGRAETLTWPRNDAREPIGFQVARNNFFVASGDTAQPGPNMGQFGNPTAVSRVTSLFNFIQSNPRVKSGPAHFWGGSGGALALLNYARANPANVKTMTLVIPAFNLQTAYDDNAALRTQMEAAYGGSLSSFQAAIPANSPSANDLTMLAGKPTRIYSSTNDPAILPAHVTELRTKLTAAGVPNTHFSLGAVGHDDYGFDFDEWCSWLAANS